MEVILAKDALTDLYYWKSIGNVKVQKRITLLIEDIQRTPFEGLGKPEALKHNFQGYWSRRINQEHRLIYRVENDTITILRLRFHY